MILDNIENLGKLIEIANYLGLQEIETEIDAIKKRTLQENASIVLPLVGEFSSGKTTLINALTDSKKLETATKPTTATIYEVHFGCESCCAKVVAENGNIQDVNDIADLKNETLADASVVTVFDTSNRVPSTTILVDTPGLSSPDPKHKQTLVSFFAKSRRNHVGYGHKPTDHPFFDRFYRNNEIVEETHIPYSNKERYKVCCRYRICKEIHQRELPGSIKASCSCLFCDQQS